MICGRLDNDTLNSVESLTIKCSEAGEIVSIGSAWRLFEVHQHSLCSQPFVCPVNSEDIIIYGGVNSAAGCLSGGVIWNSVTKSTKSIIPESELKFESFTAGISLCEDTFIGLVKDDGKQFKFVEYDSKVE